MGAEIVRVGTADPSWTETASTGGNPNRTRVEASFDRYTELGLRSAPSHPNVWRSDESFLKTILERAEPKDREEIKPGVEKWVFDGPNGPIVAVFKADTRPREDDVVKLQHLQGSVSPSDREVTIYALDRLCGLGLVPLTVRRNNGTVQLWMPTAENSNASNLDELRANCHRVAAEKLRAFDCIFGHFDRHAENSPLVFDEKTRHWFAIAIDNELALPEERPCQFRPFTYGTAHGGPLHAQTIQWLNRLNPVDIGQLLRSMGHPIGTVARAIAITYRLQNNPNVLRIDDPEQAHIDVMMIDRSISADVWWKAWDLAREIYGEPPVRRR